MPTTHHASRNFIIKAIPFLSSEYDRKLAMQVEKDEKELKYLRRSHEYGYFMKKRDMSPLPRDESTYVFFLTLLSTSSTFMNGSLTPELFMNLSFRCRDGFFLRLLSQFSHTLQFTNRMKLNFNQLHIVYPSLLALQRGQFKIVSPPIADRVLANLIQNSRYFIRQLVTFDFESVDSRICRGVLNECLPQLLALRYLRLRFPVKHCSDDHEKYYLDDAVDATLVSPIPDPEYEPHEGMFDEFEPRPELDDAPSSHRCRVLGCYAHDEERVAAAEVPITGDDLVAGLKNLGNFESLELICHNRTIEPDALSRVISANPLHHLKRLSITIFPLTYQSPPREMSKVFHEHAHFGCITNLQQLQSLTIRRMPAYSRYEYQDLLPTFYEMNNLKELNLYGVFGEYVATCVATPNLRSSTRCAQLAKLTVGGYDFRKNRSLNSMSSLANFLMRITTTELKHFRLNDLRRSGYPERTGSDFAILSDVFLDVLTGKFPLLEHLDLRHGDFLTNESLRLIGRRLQYLKTLLLSPCWNMTFNDDGISNLFDPVKSTAMTYTSLEVLEISSHDINGEVWFGRSRLGEPLTPNPRYYCLKKLLMHSTKPTAEGLIQICYALCECLEELHIPFGSSHGGLRDDQRLTDDELASSDASRVFTRMMKLSKMVDARSDEEFVMELPRILDVVIKSKHCLSSLVR